MQRIFRCGFFLIMLVAILSPLQIGLAAQDNKESFVSPELLEQAGFKIIWDIVMPVKPGESLQKLQIFGDNIYAISDKNYMLCLDRNNRDKIFAKNIYLEGLRIEKVCFYKDKLLTVAGSRLFEIDPNTGIEHSEVKLDFGIICPAARNDSYIYISGADRRLHTLRVEDKTQVFNVAADNDSLITTVYADNTFVVFGTDRGNVISVAPDNNVRLWQFNASDAIAGQIVKDGQSLYFASRDMNIYRLDIVDPPEYRRLAWKYPADGILNSTPIVTSEVLYQVVYDRGLTAIKKNDGTLLWSLPGGTGFLSEGKGKAYLIARNGTLVVMDNDKRRKLQSVNFAGVSIHAVNLTDSKIYIANKAGRIACLQPVD
ncbi:MAG: PQQ-binding-like beta-propeller repeat protein [Sedimentisphaerales bacterium]|nr:PQQ-binding-like beta-propeller repeat protein [Sedimentisphaerales bacterium]